MIYQIAKKLLYCIIFTGYIFTPLNGSELGVSRESKWWLTPKNKTMHPYKKALFDAYKNGGQVAWSARLCRIIALERNHKQFEFILGRKFLPDNNLEKELSFLLLDLAIPLYCHPDRMKLLEKYAFDPNFDKNGKHAVKQWEKKIELLLKAGANPNFTYRKGTVFGWAIGDEEHRDSPIFLALLRGGADPNAPYCLQTAANGKKYNLVKTLLLAGADSNKKDEDGRTVLHNFLNSVHKVDHAASEIIRALLCAGTNPKIEDTRRETAQELLDKIHGDFSSCKPTLIDTVRKIAYQKYLKGNPVMLRSMLGLHRKAMLGTTSEKEGACNRLTAQNRDLFEDVVDLSLAEEIRLRSDRDKARLNRERSEATLRQEFTKKMLP